jgi:hypothetical protein
MDMWGGHIRFAFHDQEAKDDEERRERGEIAMLNPQLAYMFTAQSTMRVYRQRTVRTEIRKYVGSRMISETCEDVEEWEDVTKEFERIAMRETALGR